MWKTRYRTAAVLSNTSSSDLCQQYCRLSLYRSCSAQKRSILSVLRYVEVVCPVAEVDQEEAAGEEKPGKVDPDVQAGATAGGSPADLVHSVNHVLGVLVEEAGHHPARLPLLPRLAAAVRLLQRHHHLSIHSG